jgi:secondary thiamine-phosphate synthase enzyme
MWVQKEFLLAEKNRGFHLVTDEILRAIPELRSIQCGLLHLFIQHTSASLTINENADPTVRQDLESHFNQFVPERAPYYRLGSSVSIPVTNGKLNFGIWQGIYLCEHRNRGGKRRIIATLQGESY